MRCVWARSFSLAVERAFPCFNTADKCICSAQNSLSVWSIEKHIGGTNTALGTGGVNDHHVRCTLGADQGFMHQGSSHHARIVCEALDPGPLIGQPSERTSIVRVLVGASGIEPPTTAMSRQCSTAELRA